MKKIDQINNIKSPKTISNYGSVNDFRNKYKVVGIKIQTHSKKYIDTVYYYKTTLNLKVGDIINVAMNTGGTPDCVVVSVSSLNNAKYGNLKELKLG